MRVLIETRNYYVKGPKKGRFKNTTLEWGPEYTPLISCEACKKLGTERKICYRSDIDGWDTPKREKTEMYNENGYILTHSKTTLCLSCWNKAKSIINKQIDYYEIRRLINKLTLVIRNEHKKTN